MVDLRFFVDGVGSLSVWVWELAVWMLKAVEEAW